METFRTKCEMDTLVVELRSAKKSLTIEMKDSNETDLIKVIKQFAKSKSFTIVYKMGDIELRIRNNRDFDFTVARAYVGFEGSHGERDASGRKIPKNCIFDERIKIPLSWAVKYHGFNLSSMLSHFNIKTYLTDGSGAITSYKKDLTRDEIVNMNSWMYNLSLLL